MLLLMIQLLKYLQTPYRLRQLMVYPSITTLGTITTGVWNGTAIAETLQESKGLTSYSTGDIIRVSGANTLTALSLNANGKDFTIRR